MDIYDKLNKIDQIEFDKQLLQRSLLTLCYDVFSMKGFLEVGHYRLFDFLDDSTNIKKLILTPRETMKTAIITAGVAIQEILKNHDIRILISSHTESNAKTFLRIIKSYLESNSTLIKTYGIFQSDKWNETEIIVNQRKKISNEDCSLADRRKKGDCFD